MKFRRLLTVLAAAVTVTSVAATESPASARSVPAGGHRTLHIAAYDFGYRGVPHHLTAGTYRYTFINTSADEDHEIAFFKLNDPRTTAAQVQAEIKQILDTTPPGQAPDFGRITLIDLGTYQGTQAAHGQRSRHNTATFGLGAYVYLCMVPSPDHAMDPHVLLGMIGKVESIR